MNLDIKWSEPFQWEDKDGDMVWRRIWQIPSAYLSAFFVFWKTNKYKLWSDGFTVAKLEGDWYLSETKDSVDQFKVFGSGTTPKPKVKVKEEPEEEEEFWTPSYQVKLTDGLRPWQVDSVSKIISAINKFGSAIDGSDLGVGKTYVACSVARELGMKIVVICPKAVMESWRRVIVNHFKIKNKLVDIINYEQLRIGKKDSAIASFVKNKKTHREKFTWKISKDTLIVWDESQKLKNWKTKNSKTCVEAFKQGYKMLFCSATNATNPLELRTVGTCLKLFKGANKYYQWCYEHGVSKGRFGLEFTSDMKLRTKVLKKLHKDIFVNRGVRLTRDVIPGFPESEIISACYNMDEIDVKKINQIHEEMKLELKKLRIKSKADNTSELVAILRARQQIELTKVPLFIEMIEDGLENGMSVVVFVNFTETIQAIAKRLNSKCIFDGKTEEKIRQQNVDDFQSGEERLILVNLASGGAGLSLHDIHGLNPRLALISPSYSAPLMRQCTGRVWRDGSKSKSIQRILFVAGTVEEEVCEKVNEKLKNLDLLNDGDLTYETIYEKVNT
jgi:superfamily II DNA or RNA helicase